MSNRIALMYSTQSGAIPDANQLMTGELAVNIIDGRLYTKDTGSNIILLAGGGIQLSASYALTASYAMNSSGFSPSGSFTGSFTGSLLGSSSYATTASYATVGATVSASYANTATTVNGFMSGSLTGTLTGSATNAVTASFVSASYAAQTAISSSYSLTATTVNGFMSGSHTGTLTGSATNAVSASFVSASYAAQTAISSSYALTATTVNGFMSGSHTGTLTGSATNAVSASYATTSSFVSGSYTAQWALSASWAPGAPTNSASYANAASSVNPGPMSGSVTGTLTGSATNAVSSSYALTASYAANGGSGGGGLGTHTLWIPASALIPRFTSGAFAVSQIEFQPTSSNHVSVDFTGSQIQYAQFYIGMPKSWDKATTSARFYWTHASSSGNFNVIWGIRASDIQLTSSFTGAFNAGSEITSSGGTANFLYVSSQTSNISIGTPTDNDLMSFEVYRSASAATTADKLVVNARLVGLQLFYNINASNDS